MKLTKPMIRVFSYVVKGENTLTKLAQALKKSIYWTDIVMNDLEKEGFIIKNRNYIIRGSRILVEVAHTPHALKLKELLFEYSGISFEDLITESKLLFLAAISEDWMSKRIAVQLSGISKYTIERYLPELKNRGIIDISRFVFAQSSYFSPRVSKSNLDDAQEPKYTPDFSPRVLDKNKNLYKINNKAWPLLKEFLIAYKNYSLVEGQVKWKFDKEVLFKVNNEKLIQNNATGLYAYQDYSIKVRVITALCILPKKKLSKEDIFIHSLFEVNDPRTLHLALTFYIKNNLNYKKVLPIAMKYGKYTMFNNFIKILKTKEEKIKFDNLPKFDRKDFIRVANMYGVNNV